MLVPLASQCSAVQCSVHDQAKILPCAATLTPWSTHPTPRLTHPTHFTPVCPLRHPLQARERDWANVITAHAGHAAAFTWRLAHFTLGQHVLLPPDAPQQQHLDAGPPVSAVGISCCGNFGLVGTEGGRVDRYNLQSGIHRGTYWRQQQQQQQQHMGAAGEQLGCVRIGVKCHNGRTAVS
jgi:hypothetical protein